MSTNCSSRPSPDCVEICAILNSSVQIFPWLKKLVFLCAFSFFSIAGAQAAAQPGNGSRILLYHRFGPTVADSMTTTTAVFASHLNYLKNHGQTIVPLRKIVDARIQKNVASLPPRSVAIAVDDGHITVYTEMYPLVKKMNIPVTLFIYPSAISNASYAMSWDQLRELKATGLFDIQSHSYWHPNFIKEKKRLSSVEYEKLVDAQLSKTKKTLMKKLDVSVDMIAWPFGIYDDYLISRAVKAGYVAGFSIEAHPVSLSDGVMKLPRYLLTNANKGKDFEWIFINRNTP